MADTCKTCHLVHALGEPQLGETPREHELRACVEAQATAMKALLSRVAIKPSKCDGCPAELYFIRTANGAVVPYTVAGLNHFIDCPARDQFVKKRSPKS